MTSRPAVPRILAIHAHPDDIEFQCAGTLALLKQRGCHISMTVMTPGDCGSAEMGPEEIARVRRGEGKAAADLLGADFYCLEFRDLSIVQDNDSRRRVTELFRRVRPDIVLGPPFVDYMSDHEMTARLVRDACFNASVPNYATLQWDPAPATDHVPYFYLVDAIEGIDYYGRPIAPQFIVDISETYPLRREMLACHESQRNWLRKQHGIDEYVEKGERWAAHRGQQIGVKFGEAFIQYLGHPHPNDNYLGELLGSNCHLLK